MSKQLAALLQKNREVLARDYPKHLREISKNYSSRPQKELQGNTEVLVDGLINIAAKNDFSKMNQFINSATGTLFRLGLNFDEAERAFLDFKDFGYQLIKSNCQGKRAKSLELCHELGQHVTDSLYRFSSTYIRKGKDILNEKVKRATAELAALFEVSKIISSTLDLSALLEKALDVTLALINAPQGIILLLDENKTLKPVATRGMDPKATEAMQFKLGEGITGRVAEEGRTIISEDVLHDSRAVKKHVRKLKTRALISIPLKINDEVIGVLDIAATESRYYSAQDIEFITVIAEQLAIGIRNAQLLTEQQKRTKELEELDKSKTEFLSIVSHELRTPLTSILGYVTLILAGKTGSINDTQERFLKIAKEQSEDLAKLIESLLESSRIETGRLQMRMGPVSMKEVINEVMGRLSGLAEKKKIKLKAFLPPRLPYIKADHEKINQVCINLLGNAIKFTPHGGKVEIKAIPERESLLVQVTDTGCGIPAKELPNVFDQFYQIGSHMRKTVGGSGLGLSIAKQIVDLHGGEIWAASKVRQGSTFSFRLPLPGAFYGAQETRATTSRERILLIHDDPQIADIVRFYLEDAGYKTLVALSAQEAAGLAREERFDLVILNVMTSDENCFEIISSLRETFFGRNVPVLITTLVRNSRGAPCQGVVDYVTKPASAREFIHSFSETYTSLERKEVQKTKILVASADKKTSTSIGNGLTRKGYNVSQAADRVGVLKTVIKQAPDLVLLDLEIPEAGSYGVIRDFKQDRQLRDVPVILLLPNYLGRKEMKKVHFQVSVPPATQFNPEVLLREVKDIFESRSNKNQLTGFPGFIAIEEEIEKRIKTGEQFALCYIDLDKFKYFNERYGYEEGNRVIELTADVISETLKKIGQKNTFVGHRGGDDFVVITTPNQVNRFCSGLIERFDQLVPQRYAEGDRKRGYIVITDRQGNAHKFPLMTASIAVVTNKKRKFSHSAEVLDVAYELERYAKSSQGSNYVRDRRSS